MNCIAGFAILGNFPILASTILRRIQVSDRKLGIVWGAKAIGEVIGRTEDQTHCVLDQHALRAARKISAKKGSGWFASVSGLREQFCTGDEPNAAERDD